MKNRMSITILLAMAFVMAAPFAVLGAMDGHVETITEDAPMPWFIFTPSRPKPGELVTFDASPSMGEGGIISYQWDTTGDGAHDRAGAQIRKTFDRAGEYPITLTVHDGLGRVARLTRVVRVGVLGGGVTLTIETDPPGLTVYIDGERRGQTPLVTEVAPGERKLRLRHYWLSDWETTLDLRNVESLTIDLILGMRHP